MGASIREEPSHHQGHFQAGVGADAECFRSGENGEAPGVGPIRNHVLVKGDGKLCCGMCTLGHLKRRAGALGVGQGPSQWLGWVHTGKGVACPPSVGKWG